MFQTLFMAFMALAPVAVQSGTTEAAVRQVVETYLAAREAGSEKALAALFTEDVDQLVSTGEWRKGRADVVRGTLASSQSASGKRTITVVSVRLLSPDVAVADGRYEIAGAATADARHMWTSIFVTRTRDGWRISAIRNMLPAQATK